MAGHVFLRTGRPVCTPRWPRTTALFLVVGLAAAAGCSRAKSPPLPARLPTVAAGGQVTFRGKPLAKASVVFHHDGGDASAVATTDAEGRFTLTTYTKDDGAPVGKYRLTVATVDTVEVEPGVLAPLSAEGPRSGLPAAYANPATSGLVIEIPDAGNPNITVELK